MRPLIALLPLALVAAACGGRAAPPRDLLAGDYIVAVSESAVPIAQRLTAAFAELHPQTTWTIKDVGASATLALLGSGEADVGFLSRELTVDDAKIVQPLGIGYTGQVLIVHPSNPVAGLSTAQLRGIFGGAITDWSEVGGTPGPILVVLRPASSPTRIAFDLLLKKPDLVIRPDAIVSQDAQALLNTVAATPRALGMVSALHLPREGTPPRAIAIDGVAPSKPNVASGAYPYRRPVTLVLRVNTSLVRPAAKLFRDWVHSPEGQRVLRELF